MLVLGNYYYHNDHVASAYNEIASTTILHDVSNYHLKQKNSSVATTIHVMRQTAREDEYSAQASVEVFMIMM